MRPLWERTITWGIADHLRNGGMGEAAAYRAAALVVRALDRRNNLMAEMARFSFDHPSDVDDPGKTSPKLLLTLQRFWEAVGSSDVRTEKNRILSTAVASLISGGTLEALNASVLAQESPSIEAWKGRLGQEFAGLGALRDEASVGGPEILAAYDALVRQTSLRKTYVKEFQTWAKGLGWYDGRIDGLWGPKSEGAFVRAVPMAAGRASEMGDVVPLRPSANFVDAKAFGTLITRDLWLAANPAALAAETPADVPESGATEEIGDGVSLGPSGEIVVTYPKEEAEAAAAATAAATPNQGGSRVVVRSPKPPSTAIVQAGGTTAIAPSMRVAYIGGGLVVVGGLTALGVWLATRKRKDGRP
jgi:hypothetical protein